MGEAVGERVGGPNWGFQHISAKFGMWYPYTPGMVMGGWSRVWVWCHLVAGDGGGVEVILPSFAVAH